MIQIDDLID